MRTLTRWEPFRGATALQDQVNRLFNDVLERTGEESSLTAWAPSVDIVEDDKEWVVKADLPEVKKEDVKITLEDGMLTITGDRKFEKEENGRKYHRVERGYGTFMRSFTLPDDADFNKVNAEFKNGLLTVHVPKSEHAKPKQIEVKVA